MQIEDGLGRGNTLGVNDEGRLYAECVTESTAHHINSQEESYYTLTINQVPSGAGYCIGYLKNNNEKDLHIDSIYLYTQCWPGTLLSIKAGDSGTPISGAEITAANCNFGSGKIADIDAEQGHDLGANGAALAGGTNVLNWYAPSGDGKLLDFHPMLIMPKNTIATFYSSAPNNQVVVGLGMGFHD